MKDQKIKFSYCAGPITNTKLKVIECTIAEFTELLKNPGRLNYSLEDMRSMAVKNPITFNNIKCQSPYVIGGECLIRGRTHLKSIYMLPFDIDHAPHGITLEDISDKFNGHSHFAHTTFSHNVFLDSNANPLPKFRVFVFLKNPVLPNAFDKVPKIHKNLGESVLPKEWIDTKSYVLNQAMFLPVGFKN